MARGLVFFNDISPISERWKWLKSMNDRPPARVVFGSPRPDADPSREQPRVEFDPSNDSLRLSGEIIFSTLGGTLPAFLWLVWYVIDLAADSIDSSQAGLLLIVVPMMLAGVTGLFLAMWVAFLPWLLARNPIGWIMGLIWFLFAMYILREYVRRKELFEVVLEDTRRSVDLTNAAMGWLTGWFVFVAISAQFFSYHRRKKAKLSDQDVT